MDDAKRSENEKRTAGITNDSDIRIWFNIDRGWEKMDSCSSPEDFIMSHTYITVCGMDSPVETVSSIQCAYSRLVKKFPTEIISYVCVCVYIPRIRFHSTSGITKELD